jgi:YD repeat-containing protein
MKRWPFPPTSRQIFGSSVFLLKLLVFVFPVLPIAGSPSLALADETDCIEDGGLRICSKPWLSEWKYGACVNSNLNSTINASAVCLQQNPGPWKTEGQMLNYARCMPIQESSACTSNTSLQGWAAPGSATTLGLCGSYFVQVINGAETIGYSLVNYDVTYPSGGGGQCQAGSYYATMATRARNWICPTGSSEFTTPSGEVKCARPAQNVAPPCETCDGTVSNLGSTRFGNPIQIGTREKVQFETDYVGLTLRFQRAYRGLGGFIPANGQTLQPRALGQKWTHTYDRRVYPYPNNAYVLAAVLRPDGDIRYFKLNGREKLNLGPSALLEPLYSGGTLTGWRLTSADNEIELYDASGVLLSVNTKGALQTMGYSDGTTPPSIAPGPGYLIQVTDYGGRTLGLRYDSAGRLTKMIDPAGAEYLYAYDEASSVLRSGELPVGDLTSVTYPSLTTPAPRRIYHYNEPAHYDPPPLISGTTIFTHGLTGITDENGVRYATYKYSNDINARAYQSYNGNGLNNFVLGQSGAVGNVVNRPSFGLWRGYVFQSSTGAPTIAGATRITEISQVCGNANPNCGAVSYLQYDSNGYLQSRDNFRGFRTTYTWDTNRNLETQRVEASGTAVARTITTQWNPIFASPSLITETGRTTGYTYDPNGNVLTKTVTDTALPRTRTWTYTYNANGQVLTADGPRTDISDVTTYGYDSVTSNLVSITNAANQITSITSHDQHGRPLTIVDPNGLTTTLTYHPRGWVTSRTSGNETTAYEYDNVGNLTKVTVPDASFLTYSYDDAHRLTEIQDNLGNRITYTLDNVGYNRTREDVRDPSSNLVQTRSRVFNVLSVLTREIGGTNPSAQITQYTHDNEWNVSRITAPLSRITDQIYDELNRLTQTTQTVGPGSVTTSYGYNARDQLTSVTDPRGNVTTYVVDALDNLRQLINPDTGTAVNTFDDAGNVLTSRDAKNQTTTYQYDALNRLTRATYQDGSEVQYGYDSGVNGKGRLTSITENAAGGAMTTQVLYGYDAHGRLVTETRTIGSATFVTQYGYDSAGRMNSITYPSGRTVNYTFDSVGRILTVNTTPAGGSAQPVVSNITYQPFGPIKSFTFGNGQAYTRSIDLDGRIASYTLGGTTYMVGFDDASRITSIVNSGVPADARSFGYDTLDRLTSTLTPSTNFGFTFDANGNRITKTVGTVTKTYTYPATNNKLTSITGGGTQSFVHDANGSITSDATNTFTYDTRGRLTQAATALGNVTYGLNALGQRYAKTLQGVTTLFHYDKEGRLIAESDPAGGTKREYLYLGDIPVGVIQ